MNEKTDQEELLQLVAALVNYYKYHKKAIQWSLIAKQINQDTDAQFQKDELKNFYDQNYTEDLDEIFIVAKLLDIKVLKSDIFCVIQWMGFPEDPENPENTVPMDNIAQEIYYEYIENNRELFIEKISNFSYKQLEKIRKYLPESSELITLVVDQRQKSIISKLSQKQNQVVPVIASEGKVMQQIDQVQIVENVKQDIYIVDKEIVKNNEKAKMVEPVAKLDQLNKPVVSQIKEQDICSVSILATTQGPLLILKNKNGIILQSLYSVEIAVSVFQRQFYEYYLNQLKKYEHINNLIEVKDLSKLEQVLSFETQIFQDQENFVFIIENCIHKLDINQILNSFIISSWLNVQFIKTWQK